MYGKIHQEIYDSSLMSHGWLPVHIFIGMVVLSDKDGIISIDPQILYKRLGLDEEEVSFQRFLDAIWLLEDPDELSNLSAQGGSRIIPLHKIDAIVGNRGWLVVNKSHYRDEGREKPVEDKKEYDKGYAAARRKYLNNNEVVEKSYKVVKSSYTDTDTYTDKPKDNGHYVTDFERFWQVYPKRVKKKTALEIWKRKKPDPDTLIADVENRLANDSRWVGGFVPDPTTYLNGERWNDELEKRDETRRRTNQPERFEDVQARNRKAAGLE